MAETSGSFCVDQIAASTTQRNLDDNQLRYPMSNFSLAINGFPPKSSEFILYKADNDCCEAHTVTTGFPHDKNNSGSCASGSNVTGWSMAASITAKSQRERAIQEKKKGESLESYKTIVFGSKPRSPVGHSEKILHKESFLKRVEIKNKPAQFSSSRRMSCPGRVSISDSSGKNIVHSVDETNRMVRANNSVTQEKKNDGTGLLPKITEDFEPLEFDGVSALKNSEQGKMSYQIFKTTTESEGLNKDRETSMKKNISRISVSFREMSLPQVKQSDVGTRKAAVDLQLFGAKSPILLDARSMILETKKWIRKNRKSKQKCVHSTTIRSTSAEEDTKVKTPQQSGIQFAPVGVVPLAQNDDVAGTFSVFSPATGDVPQKKTLERKVEAFLQGHQPQASLRSLKVKAPRNKPARAMGYIERARDNKAVVNTETCPSLSWINQDRSWYYQDRTGKCRYLRVPESPLPPVEWIFEKN